MIHKIAAVILAAGNSTRMGTPKQLLPYNGSTLLNHTLLPVAKLFPGRTYLVLGANASLVRNTFPGGTCKVVINDQWATGMASSLIAGLQSAQHDFTDLEAIIFLTGDQPSVTASHLSTLTDAFISGRAPIIASAYDGIQGVPALFDKKLFPELKKLKADAGARYVLKQFEKDVFSVPLPDGGTDIDTPVQYKQLLSKK